MNEVSPALSETGSPSKRRWGRGIWAFLLSVLDPGIGLVYARRWRTGLIASVIFLALRLLFISISWTLSPSPVNVIVYVGVACLILVFEIGCAIYALRVTAALGPHLSRGRWWKSTWLAAGVLLCLDAGLKRKVVFGWGEFSIPTASSAPSVMLGDVIVADVRPGYRPARGDIVIFKRVNTMLDGREETWIKRVIGLPGDRIAIVKGVVSINGQPAQRKDGTNFSMPVVLDNTEPAEQVLYMRYTEIFPGGPSHQILSLNDDSDYENLPEVVVPEGYYYVLGDNRDNSEDSRMPGVGFVASEAVIGKARTITWSRDRSRILARLQ